MLPKQTKPVRALTSQEKTALLTMAASRPEWIIARCAAIVALNTTMLACELKRLRRKDVDLFERTVTIRRDSTKTDAGSRVIPLNRDAVGAFSHLLTHRLLRPVWPYLHHVRLVLV
jgi:integrase